MTLTVAQGEWEVGDAMQEIKHGWDVLAKRLRRLHPGFKYVCVFEITKAGYPHLHVLMNSFVSHQWLSRAWAEIMRSPIVHIERVKDVGAVRYVTKYLSKFAGEKGGVNEAAFIWRIRRFTFSRGYIAKSEQWRSVIFYKGRLYAWADYCFDSLVAEFCDCWDGVSPGKDGLVIFFGDNSPGVVS